MKSILLYIVVIGTLIVLYFSIVILLSLYPYTFALQLAVTKRMAYYVFRRASPHTDKETLYRKSLGTRLGYNPDTVAKIIQEARAVMSESGESTLRLWHVVLAYAKYEYTWRRKHPPDDLIYNTLRKAVRSVIPDDM